jgi:MFS family permease
MTQLRVHLRRVHRNIILLGIVSFLNDVSSEMIIPILPLFIAAVGGGGLIVGLIGGLQESIASIVKVLAGYWSDHMGRRKPLVFGGYLISTCFKLLLAFATRWPHILFAVSCERIGKGIRTAPRDAIIADSMPEARGTGFGIHRAFDTFGAIIGSITVLLLLYFLWFELEQMRFTGYLWNLMPQHELTFLLGAAVSLSAVLLFLMAGPRAHGEGGTARVICLPSGRGR